VKRFRFLLLFYLSFITVVRAL